MLQILFTSFISGFDCSRVSCTFDCPVDLKRSPRDGPSPEVLFHLRNSTFNAQSNDPHAKEFYNSHPRFNANDLNLMVCCNSKCKEGCVTSSYEIVPNGTEWSNPDDPCTSHICNNGIVSNHISVCVGLPCSLEHRFTAPGECCPVCNSNWATFCPEDEDCDIACQHGFVMDHQRACDLCKCARRKVETSTSASTTSEASIKDDAPPPRTVHFYFYLDPTDGATRNLFIGLAVGCCVILAACLAAIGWYFHRKVYRRVPLLSLRSSNSSA